MAQWLSTPLTIVAIVAILTGLGTILTFVWKIGRWTNKIDSGVEQFTSFAGEIRADIKQIFLRLPPVPVAGRSPLELTEFGQGIAKALQVHQWATELAPTLVDEVADKRPFEVDQFSDTYVTSRLDEQWNERVAGTAYDFGIDRSGVLSVMRVVLRR